MAGLWCNTTSSGGGDGEQPRLDTDFPEVLISFYGSKGESSIVNIEVDPSPDYEAEQSL